MNSLLLNHLNSLSNEERAKNSMRYFQTWKWQYWEWDNFVWITVPEIRKTAKLFKNLSFEELKELLYSEIHEYRLLALIILTNTFEKWDEKTRKQIFDFYISNISQINNWDLVDTSAYKIVWNYLFDKDKTLLYELAKSTNLWKRRISIVSTFYFIGKWYFDDTIKLCEILMNDKHHLIHKACGWWLREVGKKDKQILLWFLEKYSKIMPKIMLSYAREKL